MTKKKNILEFIAEHRFLHILISILMGFLVGAIFLVIMGLSVGEAYGRLISSVTSLKGFSYVIVYSIPYIVVGLSVAFSFKTGVFNIGAEGQFVCGSMAAACVGILCASLPGIILIPLCFIAAMIAGAFWGLIVAALKTKWGINEVLSMIMFNWLAFYLSNYIAGIPAIHSDGTAEATKNVAEQARTLFPASFIQKLNLAPTFNWGFIVAVIVTIVIWFIIEKTTLGYQLKAVGSNKNAALYGGIGVNRSILTSLGISGALAGLGGALQLLGMGGRISVFSSQEGFGFAGIVVALIGCSNPFGVLAAGVFYGALNYGGSKLNLVGVPTQLISVIVGTVVFFISISIIFERLRYVGVKLHRDAPNKPAADKKGEGSDRK